MGLYLLFHLLNLGFLYCILHIFRFIPKGYPHFFFDLVFFGLRFYVSPSSFLLCKVMAAQTDTKDRAEPLFDTNFSGSLPQIKDLGFPKNFLPNSLAYCP